MHILVDIGHPADVHVFYHPIQNWLSRGHRVTITASNKDVALRLLDSYGLPYHCIGAGRSGFFNLAYQLIMRTLRLARLAWRDRPDVFISICSPNCAMASKIVRRPHIVFDDSEFGTEQIALYKPFTDAMCTPSHFELDFGKRQVRYNGFKELAYLHPAVFQADPEAVRALGIDPDEKYFIVRSVAWGAAHDRGEHGFTKAGYDHLIALLEPHGRVIVSQENQLPKDLKTGRVLPVEAMRHLMAFAQLLISEGLTMTTEAAVLGTPAILVNTLQAGNMKRLHAAGLVDVFESDAAAIDCVSALLANPNLKAEAEANRQALLTECVVVSDWITEFVEGFVREGGIPQALKSSSNKGN